MVLAKDSHGIILGVKALFICDNKDEWNLLSNLFKTHFGHVELVCALKPTVAFEYLSYEGPFGLVLIDTTLKEMHPSDLGREILEIAGERPLIFLGDKVSVKARVDQELYEDHEYNGVIYRPYDLEDFKNVIQAGLDWASEEEFEQSVEEFDPSELLPMKIRSFYLFDRLNYDVYLEFTSTKYARVIKANSFFSHGQIHSFARRNIKFLYLKKDEYLRFLEESARALIDAYPKTTNLKKALSLQVKSTVIIHQYINAVGVTDTLNELVTLNIDKTHQISESEKSLRRILAEFPRVGLDFAEHSVLCLYVGEFLGKYLGWNSEITRKKLGLSSLLQDCTLTNENLIKISRSDDPYLEMFTEEEQKEYQEHPLKAAELSTYFGGYPETDYLLRQHHELPNGDGFPAKINANKLTVISCAFILTSQYCARLVASKTKNSSILQEAFNSFRINFNIGNFKEPINALEQALRS